MYEFSRYSADADKSLFPAWRTKGNQTFDALLEGYLKYDPFGKDGVLVASLFFVVWPEWPDKPFLSVDRLERAKRLKLIRTGPRELPVVSVDDLAKFIVHGKTSRWLSTTTQKDGTTLVEARKYKGRLHVIATFAVDLSQSPEQLTQQFKRWCINEQQRRGSPRVEVRGPASPARKLRTQLCNLGAWRLRNEFGYSFAQAKRHAERISGKAFYESEPAWYAAIDKAAAVVGR